MIVIRPYYVGYQAYFKPTDVIQIDEMMNTALYIPTEGQTIYINVPKGVSHIRIIEMILEAKRGGF